MVMGKRTEPGPLLRVAGTSEVTGHQLHSGVCGHGKGRGVEKVGEGVLGEVKGDRAYHGKVGGHYWGLERRCQHSLFNSGQEVNRTPYLCWGRDGSRL